MPSAHVEKGAEAIAELGQQVGPLVDAYVTALEARKLKDGIRIAMSISSLGMRGWRCGREGGRMQGGRGFCLSMLLGTEAPDTVSDRSTFLGFTSSCDLWGYIMIPGIQLGLK